MNGIIQVAFSAATRSELPIFPFGSEVDLVIDGKSFRATVTKATFRDRSREGMHNASHSDEVQYTLDLKDQDV